MTKKGDTKPSLIITLEDKIQVVSNNTNAIFEFDPDMFDKLNGGTWQEDSDGYLVGEIDGQYWKAHHLVVGKPPAGMITDHKDRNKRNNLRNNLQHASHAHNSRNRGSQVNNTTGFKGVTLDKRSGRYNAQITVEGKSKHLGMHKTANAAAKAYDWGAILYHGSSAVTNVDLGLLESDATHKYNVKFRRMLDEIFSLARGVKTNDYSETWARLGLKGLYLKLFIKEGRLHELVWRQKEIKVTEESIRDTLLDTAAYAIYGIIAYDEQNWEGTGKRLEYLEGMIEALYEAIKLEISLSNTDPRIGKFREIIKEIEELSNSKGEV